MKSTDFDYTLPEALIAQKPLAQRDASRLLVLDRTQDKLQHHTFSDIIDYFQPGDILVANNSRVIPARLHGRKAATGGKVELLLLEQLTPERWRCLVGGKRLVEGVEILLLDAAGEETDLTARVEEVLDGPQRLLSFSRPLAAELEQLGETPLPPYIHEKLSDPERYQTIYNRPAGSAAAPTAGLHFTPELLFALRDKGVLFETVTLHVGLDTFQPVSTDKVQEHKIHSEWATLSPEAARRINETKLAGGRLIAVGTTSVRVLETAALKSAGIHSSLQKISSSDAAGETSNFCPWKPVAAFEGQSDLYIYPGYRYRAVDAMITNFHLPKSTLLMLVSAFAGRKKVLAAYQAAIEAQYRFYSFGDAMLII